jgi:hypothetical protein
MMCSEAVEHGALADPANCSFNRNQAIHMAITRAEVTVRQAPVSFVHPFIELSGMKQLEIACL